jgi:fucose permease
MGFIAPLLINLAVDTGLGWRAAMGLSIVLTGTLAVVTVLNRSASRQVAEDVTPQQKDGRLPRRYWLAWACLLTVMSVEMAMMQWTPEQLRVHTGLGSAASSVGVSALLGGMVVGRLAGGWIAVRIGTFPLMYATLATAATGFAIFWTATDPDIAIAGLVCCGLGISLHFPLGIALTIRASNQRFELAMSRNAYAAALSFGAAPFLLGTLGDLLGMYWAFALVPACLAFATLAVAQLARLERHDRAGEEAIPAPRNGKRYLPRLRPAAARR